jgi:PhzF family phenazine biosynthesis protein
VVRTVRADLAFKVVGPPVAVVDAFSEVAFRGNPAVVCRLPAAADEAWMQALAAEMNQPMTAFVLPRADGDFDLRWFTPTVEVEICGHATLAATHVLGGNARFHTKSGVLTCRRLDDGRIEMDFPAISVESFADCSALAAALRLKPSKIIGTWSGGEWWLVELAGAQDVRAVQPDRELLVVIGGVVVVFATPGDHDGVDSVCRVFEPGSGIDEDPVTGSAHCVIGPQLAKRTGRTSFLGEQVSPRGGMVAMQISGDRVMLRGRAVTVFEGALQDDPYLSGSRSSRELPIRE